ncbi:MAG: TonB-dependent receptor [Proteobacteria bacterium]|nr:TonB-dependent receptor [Pseudomonadota bacterium]MBU1717300.1 TonB-dependent receptor [Pseudomonadota bacterium]
MRYLFLVVTIVLFPGWLAATELQQELDEVVVTASRVSEKIKDTAVSVNVLSEVDLEEVKARNPAEFLDRIPGINSQNFGGESELTAIRVPTHFTNPYTIVLLDGLPTTSYGSGSSSQFSQLNSDNIARIEIIKGPASALYGSNAIGGIINVITKKPSVEPQVKVWSELGDYSQWRSGVSGSGGSGPLGFNLDLSLVDGNGWRDNNSLQKKAATLKSNYTPNEESLLSFKIDFLNSENDSPGTLSEADFYKDWQHSYQTFTNKKTDKIASALSYSYFFTESELSATLSLRDVEEETIPNYSVRQLTYGPFPRPYIGSLTNTDSQDLDLQLLYSYNLTQGRSKINAGLDLVSGSSDAENYNLAVTKDEILNQFTSYTIGDLAKSYDIATKVTAPYLQLESSPVEKLRITVGGRYDSAEYEVEDLLAGGTGGDKKFSKFSPKVGLTYDLASSVNGYLSYSEGFVVPTTSQLWTSRYDNNDLRPEKATSYELGLRTVFWQKRLKMDCSIYSMDITDKIVVNADDTMYVNAGESTQQGAEVMASIAPIDLVRVALSYTYAQNKYDVYATGGIDYSGNWQPRSPKHHLNARVTLIPVRDLEVELEMDEISTQYADDANLHKYTRPTLFNLRASYNWQAWSFWTHLLNLGDKEYATYVSDDADGMNLYSGAPRTIFAGLSYKFGAGK